MYAAVLFASPNACLKLSNPMFCLFVVASTVSVATCVVVENPDVALAPTSEPRTCMSIDLNPSKPLPEYWPPQFTDTAKGAAATVSPDGRVGASTTCCCPVTVIVNVFVGSPLIPDGVTVIKDT